MMHMISKNIKSNKRVLLVSSIVALAGLLFGLDMGFINLSLKLIQQEFALTTGQSESVTASLLFGAAIGAAISGFLSYHAGRKRTLLIASLIFCIASFLCIASHSYAMLVASRSFLGIAVGMSSFVAPLYLSEIAPAKIRGRMIAMYQLMITIGVLWIFISNFLLQQYGSWRLMMVSIIIPAATMFICCFFLPCSPRWLVLKGKPMLAESTLQTLRNTQDVSHELTEIEKSIQMEKQHSIWKNKWLWRIILLGVLLQILQQTTGANVLLYYSTKIFHQAGFENNNINTVLIGLIKVITTLFALFLIDKTGRKPLLYFGIIIMILSLICIGYLFNTELNIGYLTTVQKNILLIFSLLIVAGFAISVAPVVWVICSEIFPLKCRDSCITISTTANWLTSMLIGRYALSMFDLFGYGNTFYIFACCCLAGLFLVCFFTPETKQISLECIEKNLKLSKPLRHIGKQ